MSVGITVDSYIVYFERLKDEARAGRSVRSTVDRAFQGAFRTVLAADLVSLIAALTLYLLSVGDRSGASRSSSGLATLLDIFTTFFFTRPLVIWLGRNRKVTEARFIGIARGLAMSSGAGVMTTVTAPPEPGLAATKRPNAFVRLYRGETSFDFVGRRKVWYVAFGAHHRRRARVAHDPGVQPRDRLQGRDVMGDPGERLVRQHRH